MTDFIIKAPNGKKYRVSGETKEGALAALKKHLGNVAPNSSGRPGADAPVQAPVIPDEAVKTFPWPTTGPDPRKPDAPIIAPPAPVLGAAPVPDAAPVEPIIAPAREGGTRKLSTPQPAPLAYPNPANGADAAAQARKVAQDEILAALLPQGKAPTKTGVAAKAPNRAAAFKAAQGQDSVDPLTGMFDNRAAPAMAPNRADIDTSKIGTNEDLLRSLAIVPRGIASAVPAMSSATNNILAAMAALPGENPVSQWLRGAAAVNDEQTKAVAGPADSWTAQQFQGASKSMGAMIPGFAASFLTGGAATPGVMAAYLAPGAITQGGQSVGAALDAGKSPAQALLYGGTDAAAEVLFERIPVAALLGDIAHGTGLGKMIVRQLSTEVPTEVMTTLFQDLNAYVTLNPEKSVADFLKEQPAAIRDTIAQTVLMSAGVGVGGAMVGAGTQKPGDPPAQPPAPPSGQAPLTLTPDMQVKPPAQPEASAPMQDIAATMTPSSPPVAPMPPQEPGTAPAPEAGGVPQQPAAAAPTVAPAQPKGITRAEAEANPQRYEIMATSTGTGSDAAPDGGEIVLDHQTGRPLPIIEPTAQAPQQQPGQTGQEPQADVPKMGTGGTPAAPTIPAPEATPQQAIVDAMTGKPAQPAAKVPEVPSQDQIAAAPQQAAPEASAAPAPRAELPRRDIKRDTAATPTGSLKVGVTYAITDLSKLTPSNLPDGRINPSYPQERQPRDRRGNDTQTQIQHIFSTFDPRQLDQTPTTGDGAPIVDKTGIVDSGNGRAMMLARMYAERPDLAQKYVDHLKAQGYPVDGIKHPVLVRVRDDLTPEEIQTLAKDSNTDTKLAMSMTEQAMSDGKSVSDGTLGLYRGGDLDAAANRDFVRAFIKDAVPPNEQKTMIDKDGAIAQDGLRRIQAALLARAYGDAALVSKLMESAEGNIKSIGGALLDVSGIWAKMRAQAEAQAIAPEMDQTEALLEAVRLVDRARRDGRNVAEFVKQPDLLSGEGISPMGQKFLSLFFRDTEKWTQPRGRDNMAEALGFYVDEAMRTAPGADMFGSSADPGKIADLARQKQESADVRKAGKPAAAGDIFAKPPAGDGERVRPAGGDGTGPGEQGAAGQVGGQRPEGRGEGAVKAPVDWKAAKSGDLLVSGEYLAAKGIGQKWQAEGLAAKLGGHVMADGANKWAVTLKAPVPEADVAAAIAAVKAEHVKAPRPAKPEKVTFPTAKDWADAVLAKLKERIAARGMTVVRLTAGRWLNLSRPDQVDSGMKSGPSGIMVRQGQKWNAMGIVEADALAQSLGLPSRFESVPAAARAEAPSVSDQVDSAARAMGMTALDDEDRGKIIASLPDNATDADISAALNRLLDEPLPTLADSLLSTAKAIVERYVEPGDEAHDAQVGADLLGHPDAADLIEALAAAKGPGARRKVSDAWVLKNGRKKDVEHLVVLDSDGKPLAVMRGKKDFVTMRAAVWRAAADGIVAYAVHNHPRSTGPSGADVTMAFFGAKTAKILGHNGAEMEIAAADPLAWSPRSDGNHSNFGALREEFEAINDVVQSAIQAASIRMGETESHHPNFTVGLRHAFGLVLDRMGIIHYSADVTPADLDALGFNFEEIYGRVSSNGRAGLRRAGFLVPEERDQGGNQPAGSLGAGRASDDQGQAGTPAGNAGGGNGSGRVSTEGVKPKAEPPKSGDSDIDNALDALFGPEGNDVSGAGGNLERDRTDAAAQDGLGPEDVSASRRSDGTGNQRGNRPDQPGDGESDLGGGVSGDDAASVGTVRNSGVGGGKRAARKPAAGGNGGRRAGSGQGGLSPDAAGTGTASQPAGNGTQGAKLSPADTLAAFRNLLKEDVAEFSSRQARTAARTETPAFKKWFGASKVVDDRGKPLVVYHGSIQNFDAFDQSKGAYGNQGIYLTPRPTLADRYAQRSGAEGGQVYPAYVSLQNPLVIKKVEGESLWSKVRAALSTAAREELARQKFAAKKEAISKSAHLSEEQIAALKAQGYDGIISHELNEVVAFDAGQVKSVFNQGAWDASNPAMLREDSPEFDNVRYQGFETLFVNQLQDRADAAAMSRAELMQAIIKPLVDVGMTRAEIVAVAPYLQAFHANLASGRVSLNQLEDLTKKPTDIPADERAATQAKADRIKPVAADEANVRATLPLLLPEQQDDVVKIETRFAKPDGHGMLITNGTGTGKTYTGAGVVKRFVQMGKGNVLILAPNDSVIAGWQRTLDALGVPSNLLESTKDAGQGVVLTTYANLGSNNELANRQWDLVVPDEAQNLGQNKAGDATTYLNTLRSITNHPDGLPNKSRMQRAEEWARMEGLPKNDRRRPEMYGHLIAQQQNDVKRMTGEPRSKVLMLSATPFARDLNTDYAAGYLFNYPADTNPGAYRNKDGRTQFMISNFGYRFRYNKLTKPEAAVDSGVFEREFHERLKRDGVLSGRSLQIDVDYDRRFSAAHDAIGEKIDAVLNDIREGASSPDKALAEEYQKLSRALAKTFDYHHRMQLLEAIKAKVAIPEIKAHLAMGRKVVVFHDFNKGGGFNPFELVGAVDDANIALAMGDLMVKHNDLKHLDFKGYAAPVEAIGAAFGKRAAIFNGTVSKAKRAKALEDFNRDGSGVDVLVVQADAGGAGISMHDTTGVHQRALINLGMPVKPTTTLQEEGRILRVGTKTNAIFRYFTIGTAWERQAFARKIAESSESVENLALGNEARNLMNTFIDAYTEAGPLTPSAEDGKGGKERDRRQVKASPYEVAKTHYFGRPKITGTRNQRDGVDFYPTPEPLGLKMVEWAGIRQNERVLEPSAGDGAIARYMPDGIALTMVEPSSDLASRAQLRAPSAKVETTSFENYHIVNKHHVILMNPPFGHGGSTAYAHLEKAMRHLRDGGRIVAIVPTGPAADKRLEALDMKGFAFSADVTLPAVAFERAGTGVRTRVLILDKVESEAGTKHVNLSAPETISAFFDRLEGISVPARPSPKADVVTELEQEAETEATPAKVVRPAAPVGANVTFKLAQVKHAKNGYDLFVATAEQRLGDADYKKTLAVAKANGGYYSAFRGLGAVPGFQFRSEAERQAFLDDMTKPTVAPGFEETNTEFERQTMQAEARAATEEITRLMPKLRAELDRLNLGRVKLAQDNGAWWQGQFTVTGDGAVEIAIGASLDPEKTLRHEVIHALRALNLFTPNEWAALEQAATKSWVKKHDIEARYPDLTPEQQAEEAIAEEFAAALEAKKAPPASALVTAFNKIARILRGIRNVFTGAGYHTPESIFGKVLSGEIGARQAGVAQGDVRHQRAGAIRALSPAGRAAKNTGMMGAIFVPDRRVWEEITRSGAPVWDRLRGGLGGMHDAVDRARVKLQNAFLPFLRAQQAVELATGKPLDDAHNAFLSQKTFSGKVAKHFFDIDHQFTKPIIDLIAATKGALTFDDVGTWLYARHAVERNDRIADINPGMPDGGSGMDMAEAQHVLALAAASPEAATLDKIGAMVDALRKKTMALRVDAGLITQQEADIWDKMYAHYVPLKGFADNDHGEAVLDIAGVGRRFNVRGGESKRALGRKSEAFNPLQAAITQAQEVAIRAEKNRVGNAIHELAKDFTAPALWSLKKPATKRYFNKTTGMVETRVEDPVSLIMNPNEMAVKVDGVEHRILFHDERLAQAAGTVGADSMGAFMRVLSSAMMFWRAARTSLSPAFVIKNAVRDAIFSQINLRAIAGDDAGRIGRAAMKNWPFALAGVYRGQAGHTDTQWSRFYDEFQSSGAKVSFWKMEEPSRAAEDMQRRIWLSTGNIAVRAAKTMTSPRALFSNRDNPVLAFTERVNTAIENVTRLAVYVEARRLGWTKTKAAALARDVTLDFNQRGSWGSVLNTLYGFFNAGVQGTYTIANALRYRKVQAISGSLIAMGFIMGMVNSNLSAMDPDGVLAYDKIPDYQNQMSLQVMLGKGSDAAAALPLPYGFNIFPYVGQQAEKVHRGVKSEGEAMKDVALAALQAFSPVNGGDLYSTLMPTLGDPILDLARNKDWLLRPIKPDFSFDRRPESQQAFGGATDASKAIAEYLNSATGGTSGLSGAVDISPEYLDYMAAFVTGSAGSFWVQSADVAAKALTGNFDQIETGSIPIAKDYVHTTPDYLDQTRYFDFRDQIEAATYAVKTSAKTGEPLPEAIKKWASLAPSLKQAEKQRKDGGDVYLAFNRAVTRVMGQIGE